MISIKQKHQTNIERLKTIIVEQGSIVKDLTFLHGELNGVLATTDGEGKAVFVAGPSGSGKTTLLTRFYRDAQSIDDVSSAFYMTMPPSPSPKDFCVELLRGIGHPYPSEKELLAAKESALKHQIEVQIKSKNIRVLIVDEFQQLTERLGEKTMRSTADMLKNWISDFPIMMVFSGTENIIHMLNSNEQMESRAEVLPKHPMTINNVSEYVDYVRFLHGLNDVVGFKKIALYSPKIALCLYLSSAGDLRKIRKKIEKAISHAAMNNDEHVLESHFKETFTTVARAISGFGKIRGNIWNKSCNDLEQLLNMSYDIHHIQFAEDKAA